MFVYTITNTVTGKVYVGQTVRSPSKRWAQHLCAMRKGTLNNPYLLSAFKKYGESCFQFNIVCALKSSANVDDLNNMELFYIDWFNSLDRAFGYNIRKGGHNGGHLSDETKEKIGSAHKGKTVSPIVRDKISKGISGANNANYGVAKSNEIKNKISTAQPNRKSVVCCTTKQWYGSLTLAAKATGHGQPSIGKCCKKGGGSIKSKGITLYWRYSTQEENILCSYKEI